MLIIKNARILTMTGDDLDRGDILIKDGKIAKIGEKIDADGAEIFDAQGLTAIPGIVDAHCHLGMWEDGITDEGADGNETTDPVTPELRAIDAINPVDRCFSEALAGGVTTVVTGPGSANVIGGQFAALKTYGDCVDEMVIREPHSLKTALGENPKGVYSEQKVTPSTRMATAALFREAFIDAGEYEKEKLDDEKTKLDFKKEVLIQALHAQLPVKIHAHRADDIQTAIRLSKEFGLRISLDHCTEGYMIPAQVKKSGAKVILGPFMTDRCKPELKNMTMEAPRILYENGVEFAIMSGPSRHAKPESARGRGDGGEVRSARIRGIKGNNDKCRKSRLVRRAHRLFRGGQGCGHRPVRGRPVRRAYPRRGGVCGRRKAGLIAKIGNRLLCLRKAPS